MGKPNPKPDNPISLRPAEPYKTQLKKIAEEEKRTVANVIRCIIEQYLASTNGKLLRKVHVVEGEAA